MVQYLEGHGIRPILNYAAEDDVKEEGEGDSCPLAAAERKLDRNLDNFMRSIRDSDNIRNRAFVAIKVRWGCSILLDHARRSGHPVNWPKHLHFGGPTQARSGSLQEDFNWLDMFFLHGLS